MTAKTVLVRHRLSAEDVVQILAFECRCERDIAMPTNVHVAETLIREHLIKWGTSKHGGSAYFDYHGTADARVCVAFLYPELAAPQAPSLLAPKARLLPPSAEGASHFSSNAPSTLSRLR